MSIVSAATEERLTALEERMREAEERLHELSQVILSQIDLIDRVQATANRQQAHVESLISMQSQLLVILENLRPEDT